MAKTTTESNKIPLVSIVVLNWHGTEDTLRCIDSIKNIAHPNIELIIVDNEYTSSSKNSLEYVDFPYVYKYVPSAKNLGFTGGQILGLDHCSGDFICILNNDAIVDPYAISKSLETFEQAENIAAVGGRSYLLDDNGNKLGLHHYTHQSIDPITAEVTTHTKDTGSQQDVSNVSGAFVVIRLTAIKECGYFDKNFFAYYEETDLFSRFRRKGWRIVFNPDVVIWHKMGASTRNKKYMYNYLMFKNQFLFAYKNFDKQYYKFFKQSYRRHVRRAFMIYLKKFGRFGKDDLIHKARVHAYFHNILMLPRRMNSRKAIQRVDKNFNLNEVLFTDNPLPISMFVDATRATPTQIENLRHNTDLISKGGVRIAEMIIVSKQPLYIEQLHPLVRIENVVDKGIFSMSPLDFFFMASNHDLLLFGSELILEEKFDDAAKFSIFLKGIYSRWSAREAMAIATDNYSRDISLNHLIKGTYSIIALRKQVLVNHLAEQSDIFTISNDTITDVVARAVAQGLPVITESVDASIPVGIDRGAIDFKYEPILQHPARLRFKQLLTRIHIWGLASKILRRLKGIVVGEKVKPERPSNTLPVHYSKHFPVIINTRDRYDPLVKLLEWFTAIGHNRILLIDNDSAYPPLLELFANTPFQVVKLGRNAMHKAPWESMGVRFAAKDEPYILSDPDILPPTECEDAISHFSELLNKYPYINKVGFGLRIDDVPEVFSQKKEVLEWESRYWSRDILLEPDVYKASLDTTLALYRGRTWWFLDPSIRTGGKYAARHEPWYQDSTNPTEDFVFYRMRASREVSTWGLDTLPKHHMRALRKEGYIDELIDEED